MPNLTLTRALTEALMPANTPEIALLRADLIQGGEVKYRAQIDPASSAANPAVFNFPNVAAGGYTARYAAVSATDDDVGQAVTEAITVEADVVRIVPAA